MCDPKLQNISVDGRFYYNRLYRILSTFFPAGFVMSDADRHSFATGQNDSRPRLPPNQQLVGQDRWPFVGERTCNPANGPWTLHVTGLVKRPIAIQLAQLAQFPQTQITTDIHCVTRWSKFDVTFSGVLLGDLLDSADMDPAAQFVSFVARSDRQHSSSMPLAKSLKLGTLLATSVDGQPLPDDHGGPLRGVVPGKYFYKSVKWVERIELLAQDRPGFWESDAGYHNSADPWLEQRYIAGSIDRREAARLIESRNFAGLDLLSLDASQRDLRGLNANKALLRNANFSRADVAEASFRGANLSNANFRYADLYSADLSQADLEGADFAAADLRCADLRGSSLFGASFCDLDPESDSTDAAARMDGSTRVDLESLERLTKPQKEFVLRRLGR